MSTIQRGRETSSSSDILLYVLAVFVPPLALALRMSSPEISGCDIIINVLLWILGWIPAVYVSRARADTIRQSKADEEKSRSIHAWWKLGKAERARNRTVVYTTAPGPPRY